MGCPQVFVEGVVSTIIPVHNRPLLLREAVSSVLAQSYRPIEIIIVDDGSTDDTPQVALTMQSMHRHEVQVVRIPNGGPGVAREAGRRIARGEFIQYLDSDDLLLPDKFEGQVSGLRQFPNCDIAYGQTLHHQIDGKVSENPSKRTGEVIETLFPSILESRWWDTSTPLYRRALTDRGGAWSTLRSEEDWEYDCRLARFGVQLHYCPVVVSITRSHKGLTLCDGGWTNVGTLADRAAAHELILGHGRAAGISPLAPEMQHFVRELFLLSRQCGAAGLAKESERLFYLAREASGAAKDSELDFRLYGAIAKVFGWTLVGSIACCFDRIRAVTARLVHFEQA